MLGVDIVYVDIPDPQARWEILLTHVRNISIAPDVNLRSVANDARLVCLAYFHEVLYMYFNHSSGGLLVF